MKAILKTVFASAVLFALWTNQAVAAITDSSFYGFTVKHEYVVKAHPDSLYSWFHRDISRWWSPLHTFSGNSVNLIIQPKANGCFCEKLKDGGSVRHMTVINAAPGRMIRMSGGIGPLQEMAVNGVLTVNLKETEGGTAMTMTYAVGGYAATSLGALAPVVDRVLGEQFGALKRYAESGSVK